MRWFALLMLIPMMSLLIGCGDPAPKLPSASDYGSEDGLQVASLIEDVNESKADAKKLAELFATKPMQPLKGYDPVMFELVGKPTVNGDEATAEVKVLAETDRKEIAKVTWTFQKVSGKWKLKTAPLM